jgi:hypothetical protein
MDKASTEKDLFVVQQPGDPPAVQHASDEAHCLLTRNLLFDLELLAHADYFVGTTKSGLAPIVEVRFLFPSAVHMQRGPAKLLRRTSRPQ